MNPMRLLVTGGAGFTPPLFRQKSRGNGRQMKLSEQIV